MKNNREFNSQDDNNNNNTEEKEQNINNGGQTHNLIHSKDPVQEQNKVSDLCKTVSSREAFQSRSG